MTVERRRHIRYRHPLEAVWQGASGASRCRLSDLSAGGCFVQSLATPASGELTALTLSLGDGRLLAVTGRVAYVEPGMGFAIEFTGLADETRARLEQFLSTRQRLAS
ncbi:MAG: PilZ domain-containing protein [Vicinamibacterales bacterium]